MRLLTAVAGAVALITVVTGRSVESEPVTRHAGYRDVLQTGQDLGVVWDGNNPRSNPAFEHGDRVRASAG